MQLEECDFCNKVSSKNCQKRSLAELCETFDNEHAKVVSEYKVWYYKFFRGIDYKDE